MTLRGGVDLVFGKTEDRGRDAAVNDAGANLDSTSEKDKKRNAVGNNAGDAEYNVF